MTISATPTNIQYVGDGTDATLVVPFVFDDDDDLKVWSRVIATGVSSLLVKGTHYSVTGGNGATGSITMINGASNFAATVTITIDRMTPRTQLTNLVDGDPLSSQGLEERLDLLTQMIQEHEAMIARTVRFPVTDPDPIPEMPSSVERADLALTFASDGDPTVIGGVIDPGAVAVSVFGEQVVAAASAAALRALIDVDAGAIASRPVSGTSTGHLYFGTDDRRMYAWDGAAWRDVEISRAAFASLPASANLGFFIYDTTRNLLLYDGSGGSLTEVRSPLPRGHLSGLNLSVAGTTLTAAAGECRAGTSSNRSIRNAFNTAAFGKRIDLTWASGAGNGGMATGSVTTNTWYHFFIIVKPDGSVDFGFDTNVEAANLLANAAVLAAGFTNGNTSYRRLGSVRTDGSSNIIDFSQKGDDFSWVTHPALESSSSGDQSGSDKSINLTRAPTGIHKTVQLQCAVSFSGGSNVVSVVGSAMSIAGTPSVTATPLGRFRYDSGTNQLDALADMRLILDTANTVHFRASGTNACQLHTQVHGWVDTRGRFYDSP